MSVFPQLPVLDAIVDSVGPQVRVRLSRTAIIGIQHLLETTGSLVESLVQLGVAAENIALVGKSYSTSAEVLAELRELGAVVIDGRPDEETTDEDFNLRLAAGITKVWAVCQGFIESGEIDTVVVLDDGGRCIINVPNSVARQVRIIGVEQTTFGFNVLNGRTPMPVILVASSAIKRIVESKFLAEKIVKVLQQKLGTLDNHSIGILGLGNVGGALAQYIKDIGISCVGFDLNSDRKLDEVDRVSTLDEFLTNSTLILGCTGGDAFAHLTCFDSFSGKTLASCSSEDIEFNSLLKLADKNDPYLSDREIQLASGVCRILRGGFPINFDGSRQSIPSHEIQVTRGLLLAGVLQAVAYRRNGLVNSMEMLIPELQQVVLDSWRSAVGISDSDVHVELRTVNAIKNLSEGSNLTHDGIDLFMSELASEQ